MEQTKTYRKSIIHCYSIPNINSFIHVAMHTHFNAVMLMLMLMMVVVVVVVVCSSKKWTTVTLC